MRCDILTLFPQSFTSYLSESILKRAQEKNLLDVHLHDIREYSSDPHKKVDDTPYGGGAGMVMTCQPLFDAIEAIKKENSGPVIFVTPQGETFNNTKAVKMAKYESFILLCGRYEGIDQRVRDALIDEEISIGNYVLTGGELAAMVILDAVARFIPGVLGHEDSAHEDSFSEAFDGKKEHPHYTKPADFHGMQVPEVLLSGNHAEIEKWRRKKLR